MNMNTDNRVSPQAPEIEEAILGACLIEQEAMPLVADTLRPEMFYSMRHQVIYAALLAMYHDASEVLTGDLPTPVKYFNSQIAQEYKAIEKIAQQKLVDMVPDELRDIFEPLVDEQSYSEEERSIVKQADALCAYLKCLEELSAGNHEFLLAKTRLEKTLEARRSEEMDYFMEVFVPSFQLFLDEISQDSPL